ncbi:hypothetical protein AB0C01_21570 [Micromonospora sp. NPDC048905]|uniref:hypothetical protein n=1 Tax=Micromonospora sp. NPDC048905 TaxID=3155494 RepID=UPI0033FC0471
MLGLALNGATVIYDLTSHDAVYRVPPEEAVNRNGLADLGLVVFHQVATVVSGLAMAGLLLSMVGLVRGRRWAHGTACLVAAPFALCCGVAFVEGRGSFAGNPDAPSANTPQHTSAPTWVLVADVLGPPLIVGAAITVLILLFIPITYRRFHPPQQRTGPGFRRTLFGEE